jgi:translation initiation factor 1
MKPHSVTTTPRPPGTGRLHIRLDKAGRGGKTVTVISGFALSDDDLLKILKDLKQAWGTGGTLKNHWLEIQGDRLQMARDYFAKRGYRG